MTISPPAPDTIEIHQPGVVVTTEPAHNSEWRTEYEEIIETASNWIANHPWTSLFLGYSIVKLTMMGAQTFKNRKGKNLFIEVDLSRMTVRKSPLDDPIKEWMEPDNVYYRDLIDTLDQAAKDAAVAGIIVKLGSIVHLGGLARIWQLRECVKRLRAAGKKTIVYSESFGEEGENLFVYYLASCFEEIHLPRTVFAQINGQLFSGTFINKLLSEKLDIDVQLLQREKYKNFANMYNEQKFTLEHKEHVERLQREWLDIITSDIAEDRGMSKEQLNKLIDEGCIKAVQAQRANLITHVGHRDSVYQSAANHANAASVDKLNLMYVEVYNKRFNKKYQKPFKYNFSRAKKIGVIHLDGPIVSGWDKDKDRISADYVACTLRAARNDKHLDAVILHINSPGGSIFASDTVYREIELLKQAGKKVVVFQDEVAASGGYWISLPADRVIATPLTITGSIGVVFGKLNFRGMWNKIGITFDFADKEHKRQDFFSGLHSWDEEELQEANKMTDIYYDDFKDLVAEKRHLTRSEVDEMAQGKVYTGREALALKLVDQLGTVDTAIEAAKELLGLKKDDFASVSNFPPTPTLGELVMRSLLKGPEKKRSTRDEDDARRHGTASQSVMSMVYQSTGISAYMRRISALLTGNISLGELHYEVNSLVGSRARGSASSVEAYAFM